MHIITVLIIFIRSDSNTKLQEATSNKHRILGKMPCFRNWTIEVKLLFRGEGN